MPCFAIIPRRPDKQLLADYERNFQVSATKLLREFEVAPILNLFVNTRGQIYTWIRQIADLSKIVTAMI
jgi:hypothetical protein